MTIRTRVKIRHKPMPNGPVKIYTEVEVEAYITNIKEKENGIAPKVQTNKAGKEGRR